MKELPKLLHSMAYSKSFIRTYISINQHPAEFYALREIRKELLMTILDPIEDLPIENAMMMGNCAIEIQRKIPIDYYGYASDIVTWTMTLLYPIIDKWSKETVIGSPPYPIADNLKKVIAKAEMFLDERSFMGISNEYKENLRESLIPFEKLGVVKLYRGSYMVSPAYDAYLEYRDLLESDGRTEI